MLGNGPDSLSHAQLITAKASLDYSLPLRLRIKYNAEKDSGVEVIGEPAQDFDSAYDIYTGQVVVRRADGYGEENVHARSNHEVLPVRPSLKGDVVPAGLMSEYEWEELWVCPGIAMVDKRVSAPTTGLGEKFSIAIGGHMNNVYHAQNTEWMPGQYLKLSVPPVDAERRAQWASSMLPNGHSFRLEDQRPTLVTWSPYTHLETMSEMRHSFWMKSALKTRVFSELDPNAVNGLPDDMAIPMAEARSTLLSIWMAICVLEDAKLLTLSNNLTSDKSAYDGWKTGLNLIGRADQKDAKGGGALSAAEKQALSARRVALAAQLGLHGGQLSNQRDDVIINRLMGMVLYQDMKMPIATKNFLSVSSLFFNSQSVGVQGAPENVLAKLQLFVKAHYETLVRRALFQDTCKIVGKTTENSQPGNNTEVLLTGL
jgi:hypothetical protein